MCNTIYLNMKSYLILTFILVSIRLIRSDVAAKDYYDLNDGDQHVQVVKLMVSKLNSISNETSMITNILNGVKIRFDKLDTRVDKISQDFVQFKTDISKRVQDQDSAIQKSLSNTASINKRLDDLELRLNVSSKDVSILKVDMSKTVQDRNAALKKELQDKFGEITQLLKKSSTDISAFKSDVSKVIEEHKASLAVKVNETIKLQERQQNQIKLLWEHKTEWNVILRRQDGTVDFNRNWTEYKNGFGDPSGEFFVGMEILHKMTSNGLRHEIIIALEDFDNHQSVAKYDNIIIGSEQEQYVLKEVGAHGGDASDALTHHMGEKFSTKDRDNDHAPGENCAETHMGAWWFYKCNPSSQLFAPYKTQQLGHQMRWNSGKLSDLKFVEVKIRQV